MQSVSSRIWTRVAVSISYDDNHYTTGTSINCGTNDAESISYIKAKINHTQQNNHHHHHHIIPLARISLALSRHFSLWFIASGRSSGLYPVSSHSFCPAICRSPLEYITYELVPASPAVSCMSGSSNLDSFRDGRQVAV